ncbi:hypothetical protein M1M30_gp156 [Maribacter phage Colly_1]|uniref:Uncharacterized protein n=1 Tax=Maribacter phage Colly_1 TaxID=2745691 RepID=A0A8E4UXW3_9CAUD|nr:hypothetical protein M1M30_gp156 [Maribacter phage Colly_1]QQO97258.1 hypothetical protein Colly1_156 [Maribacter phage Colly_1]
MIIAIETLTGIEEIKDTISKSKITENQKVTSVVVLPNLRPTTTHLKILKRQFPKATIKLETVLVWKMLD